MASENGVAEDFDRVHPENRSFKLGGETFHWAPLHWREFGEIVERETETAIVRAREAERREKEREVEREKAEEEGREYESPKDDDYTLVSFYEELIESILNYVEPSERDRFREVVNDPGRRISHLQLTSLRDWLPEVVNNRPMDQSSPSDAGRGTTAAISQAGSR